MKLSEYINESLETSSQGEYEIIVTSCRECLLYIAKNTKGSEIAELVSDLSLSVTACQNENTSTGFKQFTTMISIATMAEFFQKYAELIQVFQKAPLPNLPGPAGPPSTSEST